MEEKGDGMERRKEGGGGRGKRLGKNGKRWNEGKRKREEKGKRKKFPQIRVRDEGLWPAPLLMKKKKIIFEKADLTSPPSKEEKWDDDAQDSLSLFHSHS